MEFLNDIDLPRNWRDITTEEYIDLININKQGYFSTQLEKFCILAGIESDDDRLEDIPLSFLNEKLRSLHFLNLEPSFEVKKQIEGFVLIPFKKLTLGAWIDLDYYLKDFSNNITKIISVLYRKIKIDEWGNDVFEPYSFDIDERSSIFEQYPIFDVYAAITEFIKFREQIIKKYSFLFNTEEEGDLTEEETEGLSEADVIELNSYLKKEEEKRKLSWSYTVLNLAGGDETKMKDVFNLPFLMVFNNMYTKKIFEDS